MTTPALLTVADLRDYLEEDLGIDTVGIDASTPLLSEGRVDSFAMVDLVTWLEGRTGVRFGPLDLNMENLDTIERILTFVESKRT